MLPLLLAGAVLTMGGCAQFQAFKRALGVHKPKATATRTTANITPKPSAPVVDNEPVVPLRTILVQQLQVGHYDEGRKQLRRYLAAHPDDRTARDYWRQLTVAPDKLLGRHSRVHVVQPGDSYGTLAARYLGSATRFLALARYNHAANPSELQVGERVRIPAGTPASVSAKMAAAPMDDPGKASATGPSSPSASAGTASSAAGPELSRAQQLQLQSVALLDHGHRKQALDRMGKALDLDPKLKPSGNEAGDLRKQLLASYHQRAIVLYRDQKLDQAITLWDHVLAIDPGYEPAIVYRARARELQSRLKQL